MFELMAKDCHGGPLHGKTIASEVEIEAKSVTCLGLGTLFTGPKETPQHRPRVVGNSETSEKEVSAIAMVNSLEGNPRENGAKKRNHSPLLSSPQTPFLLRSRRNIVLMSARSLYLSMGHRMDLWSYWSVNCSHYGHLFQAQCERGYWGYLSHLFSLICIRAFVNAEASEMIQNKTYLSSPELLN